VVPVRILDRLDAIDRRMGLAPQHPKRPPSRLTRGLARHHWLGAVLLAVLETAVVTAIESHRSVSLVLVLFALFLAGNVVSITEARYRCEAWDRRVAERSTPDEQA
jgi:hypothetical protein